MEKPWEVTGDMDDWRVIDELEHTGLIEGRRISGAGAGRQIFVLRLSNLGFERMRELEKTTTSKGIIAANRWKIYGAIAVAILAGLVRYVFNQMTE